LYKRPFGILDPLFDVPILKAGAATFKVSDDLSESYWPGPGKFLLSLS
jgi:hypothetical protein